MLSADAPLHRSYLYAPGSNPRRMAKALDVGADAVVLDLEDAVTPAAKAAARGAVARLLNDPGVASSRSEVHVRLNRDGDGWSVADLDAVVGPSLDAIRLPKVESVSAIRAIDARLDELELERGLPNGSVRLYPTVESALGVTLLSDVLASTSRVARVALGASDLLADLGARGDDAVALLHVQSELVLRSRAGGKGPPIDSVHTDLRDEEGLLAAARRARSLGFVGKSIIHPAQLPPVHAVFTPTDQEVSHAEHVVAAMADAERDGHGTAVVDGQFVDAPIVARARAILALRSDS